MLVSSVAYVSLNAIATNKKCYFPERKNNITIDNQSVPCYVTAPQTDFKGHYVKTVQGLHSTTFSLLL